MPVLLLRATDVFTPNKFPAHTYVSRSARELEVACHNALMTPNVCLSISGPSKSGKTVLLQNTAGDENLIRIFGAQVKAADDLWSLTLLTDPLISRRPGRA